VSAKLDPCLSKWACCPVSSLWLSLLTDVEQKARSIEESRLVVTGALSILVLICVYVRNMKARWLPGLLAVSLASATEPLGITYEGLATTPFLGYAASEELFKITGMFIAILKLRRSQVGPRLRAYCPVQCLLHGCTRCHWGALRWVPRPAQCTGGCR
jgi:hypothetical protein